MNYYNEHDPKAAAWLRELIKAGEIPDGVVDERDIQTINPNELTTYIQCHFFAGIGGWSYALKLAGWPEDEPVWTGSCPCQPFSLAGKQAGKTDARHLWPAFSKLIGSQKPSVVFGEQVASAIKFGWLDEVQDDFKKNDYEFGASILSSDLVGSPQKKEKNLLGCFQPFRQERAEIGQGPGFFPRWTMELERRSGYAANLRPSV